MVGQAATAPLKATRYGGALNKGFQTIDPTQIITKPAGAAFEKISDIAQTKASQYAPTLEKVKSYTESGFVIPPSEVKGAGTIKKGLEYLLGEKTPAKATIKNQEVVNAKIRSFLDVPENTPLNNAMQIIKDRTKPIYDEVAKIKPILVSKSKTIPQTRTGAMGEVIDIPSKKVAAQKTRSGQQILNDIEKQRASTSELYRKANNKANLENKSPDYEQAEKSLVKQQKLESELERLTDLSGNKDLAAKLKEARTDRAKGHSIENAIDKGDLNANLFAKQNKKRYVTGEGKEIIDFATDYPNLVKKQPKPSILSQVQSLIQPLIVGGGAGLLGGPMGAAAFLGARQITPPLLLSKQLQSGLGTSNFMPTGSGLLKALANQPAVTGATYIPSLLQSADIDLAREY
jgi:adenylate kinase family enzyme